MAQQVRCDDREPLRKLGVHGLPRRGFVADAVDQQESRSGPRDPEGTAVAMDRAELQ